MPSPALPQGYQQPEQQPLQAQTLPFLRQLLQQEPRHPALVLCEGAAPVLCWSFADLQRETAVAQQMLREQGVRPGERILVLLHDSPFSFALLFATLALGCCHVPLAPGAGLTRLAQVLADSTPRLVVAAADTTGAQLRLVLRHCRQVLRLRPWHPRWLRALLVPRQRQVSPQLASSAVPDASGPALLLYSSGSTGSAKALVYSRAALDTYLQWQRQLFAAFPDQPPALSGTAPSPRLNLLPLAHFGGLSFCLQALLEGRCVWLASAAAPAEQLALVHHSACQLLLLVPALYDALLQEAGETGCRHSVRHCLAMGESLAPALQQRILARFGVPVLSAYGMSEALSGIGHASGFTAACIPAGSCGRLLFGEAKLLDPVTGEEGDSGELWIRNATTGRPCYRDAHLVQARYSDGWFRTGDLFRRDEAGWYYCEGRLDGLCIVNGHKVFPQQVEQLLLQHPVIRDCIVAPLQLCDGRRRLGALVCAQPGLAPDLQDLLDHCVRGGALHAVPAWITCVEALPQLAAGKPDRKAATALLAADYRRHQLPAG